MRAACRVQPESKGPQETNNMTMHQEPITEVSGNLDPNHHDDSSVWLQLRQATRPNHEAIEENPYLKRLLAGDISKEEYVSILKKLAAFYAPVEDEWLRWASRFPKELEIEARACKTALLREDLAELDDERPDQQDQLHFDLAPFQSLEEVWGCVYVIEGSTVGGQLIAKALANSLGVTTGHGGSFYSPYGETTALRWQIFRKTLNDAVESQALDLDKMTTAARSTFSSLDRWMAANP
jgi:heme oxygenase